MTQKIHKTYGNVLMVLDALKAHFHYSLNPTESHIKHYQGAWHMYYRNHSQRNLSGYKNWTL